MAGKFVLKKGSTGKYHFNLVVTNGQVIATSEAYESKASALNGIESVKKTPERTDRRPNKQISKNNTRQLGTWRARGVPERTVISGEARSLTGLPALLLPRRLAEDRHLGRPLLRLHRGHLPGRAPRWGTPAPS
jgi:uncharacterized protein